MKKVLTLMGALSVAGSALAHDYLWNMSDLSEESWTSGFTHKGVLTYNGNDNSSFNSVVKGVVSSVKGDENNNSFSFGVQAGDIITVHAYNLNPTAGKVYFKETSVVSADIDNDGTTLLTVTAAGNSTVKVYADANVAITKITVVSAKYREVVDKLAEARAAIDTQKEGIAKYVTEYPNFYSAVTRQISEKVSNEILRIENQLAEDAANNVVSSGDAPTGGALIAELGNLEGIVLVDIINAANTAVGAYETAFLTSTEYSAAQDALTEAKNKNVASGSHPYSMYKKNGSKIELKATGLDTYMDTYAQKYFEKVCADAKAELDNFPWKQDDGTYGSYPTSDYTTKVFDTEARVHNIIDRFVYEKNNAQKFTDQKELVNTVANDITATGLDKPAGFDDWKTKIEALYDLLNTPDNKHVYNNSQITGAVFTTPYNTYKSELESDMAELTASAKSVQEAERTKVQEDLNKYSAQITELYTGQPETQAKYEQKFAALQVRLDVIKNYTTYAQRVTAYATVMEELGRIDGEILQIWGDSQGEKIAEIIAQNQTKYNTLTNDITDALKQYAEMVNRINGYKKIPGIEDDQTAIDAINAQLANVFEYAYKIETTKKNAGAEYIKVQDGSASFDYDTYKGQVDDALADITTATQLARGEANYAAYYYLTANSWTQGTLAYANTKLNNANRKYDVGGSKSTSYLAPEAVTKIGNLRTEYYTPADTKINSHWNVTDPKQCDIADYVKEIENDLNPIYGKLTEIDNQVNAYDASAAKITSLKIRWSVAKANVDPNYTSVLIPMLNTINEDVTKLEGKLQSYGFAAMNHETEINDEVARLNDELWKVENYTKYLANEAALVEIKDAIKTVKIDEINAAKAEVQKLVTEEVKTDYIQKLEAIDFTPIETVCANHYNNHDLDDNTVKAEIKGDLAKISAQIKQYVEDAKAADKAAQEVPGDVNGDKSVDAADYEAIEYFAVAGDDAELTDEEKALRAKADLNGDGTVDIFDLGEFVKLYHSKNAE